MKLYSFWIYITQASELHSVSLLHCAKVDSLLKTPTKTKKPNSNNNKAPKKPPSVLKLFLGLGYKSY